MLKSADLLHKCGLGDSDMSSTVNFVQFSKKLHFWNAFDPVKNSLPSLVYISNVWTKNTKTTTKKDAFRAPPNPNGNRWSIRNQAMKLAWKLQVQTSESPKTLAQRKIDKFCEGGYLKVLFQKTVVHYI